ncbi:hypothetical protein B0H19DRAFT_1375899 [Mycena capillaripes]|nr:hypothetical protein B0H19DRAFT_1375899 [Mycena capillaripes]
MPDAEKGGIKPKQGTNPDEDAAAAKLWAVYVSEAEKYDRSLVETWKSDMEGLLIFAALFSAILTAFIIESYKSLTFDPGDATVLLLTQISQQLAASANGGAPNFTPIPPFTPTATSVVCNALWFISLGFSLACALIATLVQQWSRDFLHKADMRSAPIIRARIFSYLYYGLKRFQMHVVVEVIPLLLHVSLLLFFCGLVAFLIPVNVAIMAIASTVLAIVIAAYFTLTLLPLRYLDCPYRTPLSGAFWRVFQFFKRIWYYNRRPATEVPVGPPSDIDSVGSSEPSSLDEALLPPTDETMVEAMSRTAMGSSTERSKRDYKALVWTMKSLTDDVELEPFVEAIPDLLWGPTYRRKTYEDHIQGLLCDPEVQLLGRIETLLDGCHAGILSLNASQRRIITCCKALWAIATLSVHDQASNEPIVVLDFTDILDFITRRLLANEDIAPYRTSATAMMALSTFLGVRGRLMKLRNHLVDLENENERSQSKHVLASFNKIRSKLAIPDPWNSVYETLSLRSQIEAYLSHTPKNITLQFLLSALRSESPPYHFDETCLILRLSRIAHVSVDEYLLDHVISGQMERLNNASDSGIGWIDGVLSELLSLWRSATPHCIPRAIIIFLNQRDSDWGLQRVFLTDGTTEIHLWNCFPRTLIEGASESSSVFQRPPPLPLEASFTALWRLAFLVVDHEYLPPGDLRSPAVEAVLQTLSTAESRFAPISRSVIVLLKFQILRELDISSDGTLGKAGINHPALPSETAISFPNEFRTMQENDNLPRPQQFILYLFKRARTAEARVDVIAEYLEHCTSQSLPYNALITFDKIACNLFLHAPIHPVHQIRLASSIDAVLASGFIELLGRIVNCACWALYARGHKTEEEVRVYREELRARREEQDGFALGLNYPWLDNPIALQKIKDVFMDYEKQLNLSSGATTHLQNILLGVDSWHT